MTQKRGTSKSGAKEWGSKRRKAEARERRSTWNAQALASEEGSQDGALAMGAMRDAWREMTPERRSEYLRWIAAEYGRVAGSAPGVWLDGQYAGVSPTGRQRTQPVCCQQPPLPHRDDDVLFSCRKCGRAVDRYSEDDRCPDDGSGACRN